MASRCHGNRDGRDNDTSCVEAAGNATTPEREPEVSNGQRAEEVLLFMTLNSDDATSREVPHSKTEIPETMSALAQAEHEGLGHREVLHLSDPDWDKNRDGSHSPGANTYADTLGQDASQRVTWWESDEALAVGQVKIDGNVYTLGTGDINNLTTDRQALLNAQEGWLMTLTTLGMAESYANAVINALLKDKNGDPKALSSGAGATNELVQFAVVMYRAELGELNVSGIVFSGHHWNGDYDDNAGWGIWGDQVGGDYNDMSDFFSLLDVHNLKPVFPNAYGQVKSVQLAACNTHALGLENTDEGIMTREERKKKGLEPSESLSTNEYLTETFENIETATYWTEVLAPLAHNGAETNGEYALDAMRVEKGEDPTKADAAWADARHDTKGITRSQRNDQGELEDIELQEGKNSTYKGTRPGLGYGTASPRAREKGWSKGLRKTDTHYQDREDLADWRHQVDDKGAVTLLADKTMEVEVHCIMHNDFGSNATDEVKFDATGGGQHSETHEMNQGDKRRIHVPMSDLVPIGKHVSLRLTELDYSWSADDHLLDTTFDPLAVSEGRVPTSAASKKANGYALDVLGFV
jgi:hypothetical protein